MTPPDTSEILRHMSHVVAGTLSVREFEDWFVPATWDIETAGDATSIRLAHKVLGLVSEFDSEYIGEVEFRAALRPLLATRWMTSARVSPIAPSPRSSLVTLANVTMHLLRDQTRSVELIRMSDNLGIDQTGWGIRLPVRNGPIVITY